MQSASYSYHGIANKCTYQCEAPLSPSLTDDLEEDGLAELYNSGLNLMGSCQMPYPSWGVCIIIMPLSNPVGIN